MTHEKNRVRGMNVHVYVGPSCPEPVIGKRFPNFLVKPPVEHGDLYSSSLADGDLVVILDGLYHHHLAIRHKEIMDAMSRGVGVIGAASIGALRAVELSSFGMIGVGEVYKWYQEGIFDGDDAVAVAQAGSGSTTSALSIPLVNIHAALERAVHETVLDRGSADRLLLEYERRYYPQRTRGFVIDAARKGGVHGFARWFAAHTNADPAAFDQKRADCLRALDVARERVLANEAASRSPSRISPRSAKVSFVDDGRDWRTEFERRWRNTFTEDLHRRLAYQQIFNVRFPRIWWEYLNRFCPGPAGDPGDRLRDHVIYTLGESAAVWLKTELGRDRITHLIRPTPDLSDPEHSALLLSEESSEDRSTVAGYLAESREYLGRRPGRGLRNISEDQCLRLLAGIWHSTDITTECGRRGFQSPRQAVIAFKPFVIGFLIATVSAAETEESARA